MAPQASGSLTRRWDRAARQVAQAAERGDYLSELKAIPTVAIELHGVFHQPRHAAFTGREAASQLTNVPYSLRHAAVATWLAPPSTGPGGALGRIPSGCHENRVVFPVGALPLPCRPRVGRSAQGLALLSASARAAPISATPTHARGEPCDSVGLYAVPLPSRSHDYNVGPVDAI